MIATVPHLCECDSLNCGLKVDLPTDVALWIHQNDQIVIVDGCKNGPSKGDTLVEECEGYKVYRPAN